MNLDKFGAQKRGTSLQNKSKFKSFIVESPLPFKLHLTHLCSRKLKEREKIEKKKFLTAQKLRKQFCDVIKCHVINFFALRKLVLLS